MSATIAEIAWPGPRPLSFEDAHGEDPLRRLVGRERELDELLHACQTYAVVEITAPSGVGKTSFVAAARPHLEAGGATVVRARPWSEAIGDYEELAGSGPGRDDPVALYCLALGQRPREHSELRAMLDEIREDRPLVCIFDQLEELLRYHGSLGVGLLELVATVAAANGVPHVAIARSEFRDQLRPLEIPEAPTWHMLLKELSDPEVIRRAIEQPVPDGVLEDGVAERLATWWEVARAEARTAGPDRSGPGLGTDCGLLHLQALLWAVREWAGRQPHVDQSRLTLANLAEYATARGIDSGPQTGGELIADAMLAYVEDAIDSCEVGLWPNGPRQMLARTAAHFSAAGFKVPQPLSSLIARAMQEELGSSRSGHAVFAQAASGAEDRAVEELASRFQVEAAGVADGRSPGEVGMEMLASLRAGLRALADEERTNILRCFKHGSEPIYELVHDGVAPALDRWADSLLEEPIAVLGGITARRGEIFSHDLAPDVFLEDGKVRRFWSAVEPLERDGRTVAVLTGVKWRGLGVHHPEPVAAEDPERTVLFEDIVFRDCVFVGTLFRNVTMRRVAFERCEMEGIAVLNCTFEDVSFVDCPMSGAAFNECTFAGTRFECGGKPGAMSYVAFRGSGEADTISIAGLRDAEGVFFAGIGGGDWSFDSVEVSHFSFRSAAEDVRLRIGGASRLANETIHLPRAKQPPEIGPDVVLDVLANGSPSEGRLDLDSGAGVAG